jgi:hypothetical protein
MPNRRKGERKHGPDPWQAVLKFLLPLLAAAILTLAASLTTASPPRGEANLLPLPARGSDRRAPAVLCEHPRRLRLHRFEDRSARLECAGRVLLRVSVPG